MVKVLPAPVCPYAIKHPWYPAKNASVTGTPTRSKISLWV